MQNNPATRLLPVPRIHFISPEYVAAMKTALPGDRFIPTCSGLFSLLFEKYFCLLAE
jgi:hypothetical protein